MSFDRNEVFCFRENIIQTVHYNEQLTTITCGMNIS